MGFNFEKEYASCAEINILWEKLYGKSILIVGATGLIGKYLIRVLLERNAAHNARIKIVAMGRSKSKFKERFTDIPNYEDILFIEHDIQKPFIYAERLDYIVHMASNVHPRLYAKEPIATEMTNILGAYYLLELASKMKGCRFVFVSSGDVYGDNRSGKEYVSEEECGYFDCNTLRAGYIEGKRASEALCNAFSEEKGVDFVIARLCRVYGATMQIDDSKAISQFINKAVMKADIILKSEGTQTFSYLYVYDVVSALLTILTQGKSGEAYNVADNGQVASLKQLAEILRKFGECGVLYDLPDDAEAVGASSFQDIRLDATKLCGLGWKSQVPLDEGLQHTVDKLREIMSVNGY